MTRWLGFALLLIAGVVSPAPAADWVHWRGPEQTGQSRETGLPDEFQVDEVGKGGLLWRQPYGGRSAPLILKGNLYTISGYDMSLPTEGERIMCFDAETGAKKWEKRFNVFHTDVVSSRLGWTSLTADPEAEHIFAHTTGGFLFCIDKDGKEVWKRQLTEEFGRVTGYGGRSASPIFDSGLVILGFVNGSWGDQAIGRNRFAAFDGKTGEIVWWASPSEAVKPPFNLRGTYYSNPVIAVINGQRLLISGCADGAIHAMKVRTGEQVWSYLFSAGVVNPSPVVDGNLVYISHGEENPEGGNIGRVICLDASKVDPKTKKPALVWENKKLAKRFGLASPALADGKLYVPDDAAELVCFNAKDGKVLWKAKYGTVSRGAPLVVDGKLYIFDVSAKLTAMTLNGDKEPEKVQEITFRRLAGAGFVETHGTPIAVNGKLYFLTQEQLYCVGNKDWAGPPAQYKLLAPETTFKDDAAPTAIRVFPADVETKTAADVKLAVKFLDNNGREVKAPADAAVDWALPAPPLPPTAPKGATPPPALNAEIKANGASADVVIGKLPRQQGMVAAKFDKLTARSRVRVIPQIPYKEDFEKVPLGGVPSGWINTQGKYTVVELKEGDKSTKVLSKVNTDSRPPLARANAYITSPWASNYTIEADLMGTEVGGKLADMGVVNCRYTLILDGKSDSAAGKRQARIVSWEARPRVNQAAELDWQSGVWYRVKFTVVQKEKTAVVSAKVWKRGEAEPTDWTVSYEDPSPNREGAAALYGYVSNVGENNAPGSAIYYDNVVITPNEKK
ncbi:PQQ-like beta-propeller repeat protein [Fimbriiglobus ruber]|uniref:Pyrrolo-quinoline quinone repeat domain-containing protein n=1 Tax=Fimbriiglobus ruber TaxID=1908690 RepID=A0A225DWB2_9BACT|nr:PQQ-like beta-propeller repeat protein [Fimbriiglobus ruber]OWK40487.1 hypothetical protein FRUB_05406 [Fimbriiglobus ruber]